MPKMKNATTRRIPIASAAILAISPTAWAIISAITSGEVATYCVGGAVGAAFGSTCCAIA
jgi:hypothetical protein